MPSGRRLRSGISEVCLADSSAAISDSSRLNSRFARRPQPSSAPQRAAPTIGTAAPSPCFSPGARTSPEAPWWLSGISAPVAPRRSPSPALQILVLLGICHPCPGVVRRRTGQPDRPQRGGQHARRPRPPDQRHSRLHAQPHRPKIVRKRDLPVLLAQQLLQVPDATLVFVDRRFLGEDLQRSLDEAPLPQPTEFRCTPYTPCRPAQVSCQSPGPPAPPVPSAWASTSASPCTPPSRPPGATLSSFAPGGQLHSREVFKTQGSGPSEVYTDAVAPSSWYSVHENITTGHQGIHYANMT